MAAGGGMLSDGSGLPGLSFCLCSWLWCDILHRLHAGRGWSLLFRFCAAVCPRSGGASRLFNPKEEEEEEEEAIASLGCSGIFSFCFLIKALRPI